MNKHERTLRSIVTALSKQQDRLNAEIDYYDDVRDCLSYEELVGEFGETLTEFLDLLATAENQLADVQANIRKAMRR